MITQDTPIPDMAKWLMPETASLLDDQQPELQILALAALRDWLVGKEEHADPDPIAFSEVIHRFIVNFVAIYNGDLYA